MKKIINSILHRFKEDSLTRKGENVARSPEYKELKSIKSILVFWVANATQSKWLHDLEGAFRHVKMDRLCYVPVGTEFLETDDVVALKNEDLGFGGKILNERVIMLLGRKYDLLVDLTTVSNALINYVLMNNHACCIAGMKKEGGLVDLAIDGVTGPEDFIAQLTKVLSEINAYCHE